MKLNETANQELSKRRYCVACESSADTKTNGSDAQYDYFKCARCGLTWRHAHIPIDVMLQKGFLQEQLIKVDDLLRARRRLCHEYPTAIALRISYDSLMCHRKILVSAIEMVHSSASFHFEDECSECYTKLVNGNCKRCDEYYEGYRKKAMEAENDEITPHHEIPNEYYR